MTQELIKLESAELILAENASMAKRAVEAMSIDLPANISELTVMEGDNIEESLNELRQRGKLTIEKQKAERMPFTKRMDEIKSLFTAQEKAIEEKLVELKAWSDKWAAEKNRRIAEDRRKNDLKIAHENAKIDYNRAVAEQIALRYNNFVNNAVDGMNSKFYKLSAGELYQYGIDLQAWTPTLQPAIEYAVNDNPLLTVDEMADIRSRTEAETYPSIEKVLVAKLIEERDRLIAMIPGRQEELKRIANDAEAARQAEERIAKAAEERALEAEKSRIAAAEAAEAKANTAKLETAFAASAVAPAVELSKGTVHKKKYNPTSHQDYIKVMQWWAVNNMNLMTVDELHKKFSFMFTAANKELNKGTIIEGIEVVDDFSTRTSRK